MKEKVLKIGKNCEVCAKDEILIKKYNDIKEIVRVHLISTFNFTVFTCVMVQR